MVAATHLLVPIQAAYFAIEGTDDLLETYERSAPGQSFSQSSRRADYAV